MENETDVIREQMLETRTALTEKLEALQETVVHAVEGTTESVTETVQNVKDAVQDTVANVSDTVQETVETVKSTFDISKHVESYPWAMFGGAVALGYLGGRMFPSPETLARAASAVGTGAGASLSNLASNGSPGPSTYTSAPQPAANFPSGNQGSNWLGGLAEALKPVAHQLEGMAIGALTGVIGEMAMRAVPEGFKPQLKELIEKTTTSLGGESMDCSSLFNSSESGSEKRPEHQHS